MFAASSAVSDLDLPGIGGLGIVSVVLVMVFRTLWRQDSTWRSLIDSEREAAEQSRKDAAAARLDAAAAREEAEAAREEAAKLRRELRDSLVESERAWSAHREERARVDALVSHLRELGLPLPGDVD